MPQALIGLGSNVGDRAANIARAISLLRLTAGIEAVAASGLRATAPVGGPRGQGEFLNAAALVETSLSPEALHAVLMDIERQLGRQRGERWGARTLDLDLLLYDRQVLDTKSLVVPHPSMAFRRFVLEPAAEIAGEMVHPTIHWTIAKLLAHLNTARPYVAIAGPPGVGKTRLAEALAARLGCRLIRDPLATDTAIAEAIHSAGPTTAAEIELLTKRAALLRAAVEGSEQSLVVSDFWLDQSRAYAVSPQGGPGRIRVDANRVAVTFGNVESSAIRPKLRVLFDVPMANDAGLDKLRTEIVALAFRPDQGPTLRLLTADPAAALTETAAAVEAMR